ncbi:GNAT family N-acetyltransferase [Rhodocytophaga aerolata]|uniref:GNAT family N-acetyltransferase n=1 Tax=Rhodocytophaga aerolata TaxID=455078 RepID=A0ABT8RGM1_9BACT|nr:GNAT family N-acetyltransferase [Rhodocytophaga aerolata]MDO1451129.1 GNAT family N-acetyltransferase [Rhodocytophaga aerolata]
MNTLTTRDILLRRLTVADAEAFYALYTWPEVIQHFDSSPFLPDDTAISFTSRIIESCYCIWTIRLRGEPEKIIGDLALHHYDMQHKRIEIGGSLLPAYWGKNLMKQAFELLIDFSRQTLKIEQIIGKTSPDNRQAIKLVEKLGFQRVGVVENELILSKRLS